MLERDEREHHRQRQHHDRHQRAAQVPEKEQADQADDDAFLDQFLAQRVHGAVDQLGAVVDRHRLHAGRKGRLQLPELLLHPLDHARRVLPVAHHHDAAHRLPLAVQLGGAGAEGGPQRHGAQLAHQDRGPAGPGLHRDLPDVAGRAQVAAAAHVVVGGRDLQRLPAHVLVALAHRVDHVAEADAVGEQLVRVEVDLVLLHEAAHRGHLGHALHRGEGVAQGPVLEAAQLRGVALPGLVDQGVLVDPAHAGGVGAQRRVHPLGQGALHRVEVFQDAGAGPVDVGPVLENDVDERPPEHRLAAHELHLRRGEEAAGDRVGDLVLHQRRAASGPVGVDDDLDVGEVGDRVQGGMADRADPGRRREAGEQGDQEAVPPAPFDEAFDHGGSRWGARASSSRASKPMAQVEAACLRPRRLPGPRPTPSARPGSGSRRRSGNSRW